MASSKLCEFPVNCPFFDRICPYQRPFLCITKLEFFVVVARINSNILYPSIKKTITLNNKNGAETKKYIDRCNMFSILSEVLRVTAGAKEKAILR